MVARVKSVYESNQGTTHTINLTPDYLAAAGTAPTGAADSDIIVKVSKTKREYGIGPRGVRAARTITAGTDSFKKYVFVPVLRAADWEGPSFAPGATVTVGGNAYEIVSRVPEDY